MKLDDLDRTAETLYAAMAIARAMGATGEIDSLAEMKMEAREDFDRTLNEEHEELTPDEITLRKALGLRVE